MIAIVSSMGPLLDAGVRAACCSLALQQSNRCAGLSSAAANGRACGRTPVFAYGCNAGARSRWPRRPPAQREQQCTGREGVLLLFWQAAPWPWRPRGRPPAGQCRLRRESRPPQGRLPRHPVLRDHASQRPLAAPRVHRSPPPASGSSTPSNEWLLGRRPAPAARARAVREGGASPSTCWRRRPTPARRSRKPARRARHARHGGLVTHRRAMDRRDGARAGAARRVALLPPGCEVGGVDVARREDRDGAAGAFAMSSDGLGASRCADRARTSSCLRRRPCRRRARCRAARPSGCAAV